MAHFLTSNEKFHVFSKSPVTGSQALSQAVNKSGHTTTTSDIWAQEIPWFYATDSQANAIKYSKNAKTNDLVDINGSVYIRKDTTKFPYNAAGAFDTMWSAYDLSANPVLKNSAGEEVLRYHEGVAASLLKTDNNANQASNFAARIWVDGHLIEQFVASTDKILDGFPSTGYGVSLWNGSTPISEGELDDNFIANSYAGVIQLNKNWGSLNPNFKVNCFEYIGKKLDAEVKRISEAVFGSNNGGSDQPVDLVTQVNLNTAAIATLNGSSSETGSVAKAVSDAEGRVKTTTDALAGRIAQLEGIQHFSVVVVPDGQTIANVTPLVENTIYLVKDAKAAEGTYIEYIAYKPSGSTTVVTEKIGSTAIDLSGYTTDAEHTALAGRVTTVEGKVTTLEGQVATITSTDSTKTGSIAKALADAKSYTDTAIETELESGGSIAQAIADAKAAAIASAEVTINAGTGISIEGEGKGTTFTISVADTVATKASVEEVSAAVTGVSETVASIETSLSTGTIATGISEAKAAAKAAQDTADAAKGKADTAVQSVSKASGSSSLLSVTQTGTSVTVGLDANVATKSDITTEINKLTESNGAITTLSGKVSAIETSLAAGGTTANAIADAKSAGTAAQTAADAKVANITVDGTSIVSGAAGSKTAALTTTKGVEITPSATSASTALATEASVAKALASINSVGVSYEVIPDGQTHTSITAPVKGRIYLEKETTTTDATAGVYIEWMYTEKGWEQIGSTKTDHSSYASTITINGTTKTVANSAIDLGTVAQYVSTSNHNTWDGTESSLLVSSPIYTQIATDGILKQAIVVADGSQYGVSKMFTGNLSTAASTVTDTAVSVKSAQAMYSSLASAVSGKVSTVNGDAYLELAGIVISRNSDTVGVAATPIGDATSAYIYTNWTTVKDGIANGQVNIDTTKIAFTTIDASMAFVQANSDLTTWSGDMPNLDCGYMMFANCTSLTSFCGDLSAMTSGNKMFSNCTSLTSFCGDLSAMTDGDGMFSGCKLDAESLECIADTLSTATGYHPISIGYNCSAADAQAAYATITGKGWDCTMTYNA